MCGFAFYIRNNLHGSTYKTILMGDTVNAAISHVVQAFRNNLRPDPTLDETGQRSSILKRQIKGYRDTDPAKTHQACLPLIVWKHIWSRGQTLQNDEFTLAISTLVIGALFFAMRSCEYSSVDESDGARKTKRLTLHNIRFFNKDNRGLLLEIPHTANTSTLSTSECVSITFISQKNGEKNCTITQHRSSDKDLCPVCTWASIILQTRSYPKTRDSTPVNAWWNQDTNKLEYITSTQIRNHIRTSARTIGLKKLGVDLKRIVTHTIRTSIAMLLYMANVRVVTIMLIGRWKSDAFILYLRKQVKEFTEGVTEQVMSQPADVFLSIPNPTAAGGVPTHLLTDHDDPGIPNRDSLALSSSGRFSGQGFSNTTNAVDPYHPPAFHLWG